MASNGSSINGFSIETISTVATNPNILSPDSTGQYSTAIDRLDETQRSELFTELGRLTSVAERERALEIINILSILTTTEKYLVEIASLPEAIGYSRPKLFEQDAA